MADYDAMVVLFGELDEFHRQARPDFFRRFDGPARTREQIAQWLAGPGSTVLVAEDDDEIVGLAVLLARLPSAFAGAVPRRVIELDNLVVRADRRGRSIGHRLLRAMMAAIVASTDENQTTINEKGTGFKGFIPAVFARLVNEHFNQMAKADAAVKSTAPPELVRNRRALPDAWEANIIKNKLLDPKWPKGQAYSDLVDSDGHPAFRVMVPEYYAASCLACHGSPKGEMDITGYPKEGGKLGDLGAVISITVYH